MKILITGNKGSGKTTLARPLSELLGAIYVDDDYINTNSRYLRQDSFEDIPNLHDCMSFFSSGVVSAGGIVVMDTFILPFLARKVLKPDFIVSMEAVDPLPTVSDYKADYVVSEWFDDTHEQLYKLLLYYRKMLPSNEFIATTA